MKSVQDWISEVKTSPAKFNQWLTRQYIGEMLAAQRIEQLAELVPENKQSVIHRIADDEYLHANWVKGLLEVRCIPLPQVSIEGTRYWEPILGQGLTVQQLLAPPPLLKLLVVTSRVWPCWAWRFDMKVLHARVLKSGKQQVLIVQLLTKCWKQWKTKQSLHKTSSLVVSTTGLTTQIVLFTLV